MGFFRQPSQAKVKNFTFKCLLSTCKNNNKFIFGQLEIE